MGMDSVFKVSLVLDMIDNMTSKVNGVSGTVQNSFEGMNRSFETMQRAGMAMTGAGTAIAGACLSTVTATFDTQNALGELSSLGVEDLKAVEQAAKSFSDTWAGTTKSDFITAAYDIKSGIASLTDEGVAQFAELAALTGKATKSTTEEMGSLFATGYGIYKDYYGDMSDLEFGQMFSAGIAIAVKNYKTSGSQMADAISKLGATATNANVSMEEQLAILGQLQTTMSGSEAATKYNAFLQAAAGAGEKLGLSFVDANKQLMSTPQILDTMKTKYGETLDAMEKQELKEAFGTDEAIKYIDLLYGKTDTLRDGIDDLHTSMEGGISVTEGMAEAINNTPEQKFEVLKQKIHNTAEELGSGLLPSVNNAMDAVGNLIQKGSDWVANNQETVSTIMNIVMYLGIFLIAAGALTVVIGTVGKTLMGLTGIFRGIKTVMSGAGFLAALGPIAAIAAAVIGLIAIFEACGGDVTKLQGMIGSAFSSVGGFVFGALSAAAQYLPGFLQFGAELLTSIASGISQQLPTLLTRGAQMIQSISTGITAALPGITQKASQLLTSFLTAIITGLPRLLTSGANMILSMLQGIGMILPGIAQMATQLLLSFLNTIVSGLPSLLSSGAALVISLVSGIVQMLPSIIQSGISMIVNLAQGILQSLPAIAQSGIALVLQLLSGIAQNLPGLLSAGGQLVMNVLQGIAQLLPSILSGGLAIVGNIVSGILQGIPDLVSIGGNIVSSVWNAITETDWLSVGGDMINGIKDGFMSGFQSLVDSAKGAWDSFVGWLTGAEAEAPEVTAPTVQTQTVTPKVAVSTPVSIPELQTTTVSMPELEIDLSKYEQSGLNGMQAFSTGITNGTTGAQSAAQTATDGVLNAIKTGETGANGTGTGLMSSLTSGIETGGSAAKTAASTSMNEIMESVGTVDTSSATTIGTDIMNNIGTGISNNAATTAAAAQDTINSAMASIQSIDTGATDGLGSEIMSNLGNGITGASSIATGAAQDASSSITSAFNVDASGLTEGVTGAATTIETTVGSMNKNVTSTMQSCWDNVKSITSGAMSSLASTVSSGMATLRSTVSSQANAAASAIRNAFANIRVTVPAPTLPHVSVSYSTVGSGKATAQVPNFSVSYYASGGIMTRPTAFAYDLKTGRKLVGGEAGDEAILPLDTLWSRMREVVSSVIGNKEEKNESTDSAKNKVNKLLSNTPKNTDKLSKGRKNSSAKGSEKSYRIDKFIVNADMSDTDSIRKLLKLLDELDSPEGSPEPA